MTGTVPTRNDLVHYRNPALDSARWTGFRLRPGDIVVSTPPKSGTTWMTMICTLLLRQRVDFPETLDELAPYLDHRVVSIAETHATLDAIDGRRVIRTHTPLDGLPREPGVHYVCVARDPRDVALSRENHAANSNPQVFFAARAAAGDPFDISEIPPGMATAAPITDPVERFWAWVDSPVTPDVWRSCLAETLHHLTTFWAQRTDPSVALVHYADLKADLSGQMRSLAERFEIAVPEDVWPELVDAAGFAAMRARADVLAPRSGSGQWRDVARFFDRGTSGQGRDMLDQTGASRYAERATSLAPPDLLDWLHRGANG